MEVWKQVVQWLAPHMGQLGVPEFYREFAAEWSLIGVGGLLFSFLIIGLMRLARSSRSAEPAADSVVPPEEAAHVEEAPSLAQEEASETGEVAEPVKVVEEAPAAPEPEKAQPVVPTPAEEESGEPVSLMDRMKSGLSKTHQSMVGRIDSLIRGRKEIDADLLEDLEEILVTADLGVSTTQRLVTALEEQLDRGSLADGTQLRKALKAEILNCLSLDMPEVAVPEGQPKVILMTGVNGVGKTTTIGKLACKFSKEGQKVVLGAGDTFRAAAAEQLGIWADRAGCDLIRHDEGADPGAVVFDAVKAAVARKADTLLLDTAGRLHNKAHLMEELKKVRRVVDRELPGAPHLTLLVLDATTGQNALNQAKLFGEAVQVDGIVLTKLDGTAKGGVVIAIAAELGLPVYHVGIGEGIEDLRSFEPEIFVDALFGDD